MQKELQTRERIRPYVTCSTAHLRQFQNITGHGHSTQTLLLSQLRLETQFRLATESDPPQLYKP